MGRSCAPQVDRAQGRPDLGVSAGSSWGEAKGPTAPPVREDGRAVVVSQDDLLRPWAFQATSRLREKTEEPLTL